MITMLVYCIMSLASVAQLVMRKHIFLRWFQISGAVALLGNFIVFVLRQMADSIVVDYGFFNSGDYYWTLFIMALFWTVIWSMYFARSSRLYSYMGEDSTYLHIAFFTRRVKEPMPWPDFRPFVQTPPAPPSQSIPQYPAMPPVPRNHQQVQTRPGQPVPAAPYPPVPRPAGQPVPGPGAAGQAAGTAPQNPFQPVQPAPPPP